MVAQFELWWVFFESLIDIWKSLSKVDVIDSLQSGMFQSRSRPVLFCWCFNCSSFCFTDVWSVQVEKPILHVPLVPEIVFHLQYNQFWFQHLIQQRRMELQYSSKAAPSRGHHKEPRGPQCTMWLSTYWISKVFKSKGLDFAQFWSDNSSSDW